MNPPFFFLMFRTLVEINIFQTPGLWRRIDGLWTTIFQHPVVWHFIWDLYEETTMFSISHMYHMAQLYVNERNERPKKKS